MSRGAVLQFCLRCNGSAQRHRGFSWGRAAQAAGAFICYCGVACGVLGSLVIIALAILTVRF